MRINRVTVQPMVPQDLDEVMAIQTEAYGANLREHRSVIEGRLRLFPGGCWIAARSGAALGYLISHPWDDESPSPDLDCVIQHIPQAPTCYHIHDLAIRSSARGMGLGRLLIECAFRSARESGLRCLRLVAVQGSEPFWETFGFRPVIPPALPRIPSIACYGANACIMTSNLAEEQSSDEKGVSAAEVATITTGGTHHV